MKKHSEETQLALITQSIQYITDKVDKIDDTLTRKYVTKEEFEPIKTLVRGVAAILLGSVVVAIVALVIIK